MQLTLIQWVWKKRWKVQSPQAPALGSRWSFTLSFLRKIFFKKIIIKKAARKYNHVLGLFDPIPMQMRNLMNWFGAEVVIFHFSTGAWKSIHNCSTTGEMCTKQGFYPKPDRCFLELDWHKDAGRTHRFSSQTIYKSLTEKIINMAWCQ